MTSPGSWTTSSPTGGRKLATLLDTSALTVLIRHSREPSLEPVLQATRHELAAGSGVVSAVTAVELFVGARDDDALTHLTELLDAIPVVATDRDVALRAGRMGAHARARGATVPVPDLMIAATAVWLGLPLLTCDSDFARGKALGEKPSEGGDRDLDGSGLWGLLQLHPASAHQR